MTARSRTSLKADLENGDTFDATIAGDMVDSFLTIEEGTAQIVSGAVTWNNRQVFNGGAFIATASATFVNATQVYSPAYINTTQVSAAAIGSAQATGFAISATFTMFSDVSAGQEAARVSGLAGQRFFIANDTAANLKVFPPSGGKIDNLAANAAYVVSANLNRGFHFFTTTRIFSS